MLNLNFASLGRMCDNVNRRNFLRIGTLAAGGLTLGELLRAEASQGVGSSTRAVINIHQSGGPAHQDTFDLKPDAPVEFRGEFRPIATNVNGIAICEHLPRLAAMADKYTIIRSLVGSEGDHSNSQTHIAYDRRSLASVGGRPAFGAVVNRLLGPTPAGSPTWASSNGSPVGFLGATHRAFEITGRGQELGLNPSLTPERLRDRMALRQAFDGVRREVDASGQAAALDSFSQRAVDIVVGGRMAQAFDLSRESREVVERYGPDSQHLLRARRLVEAGVRVINMEAGWGNWDTHPDNFNRLRTMLPKMDRGLSALIWDLERLGMFEDVVVVVWGEFGRTPRINSGAGRDHWPQVSPALLTGGRFRHGQVIGATDRIAALPHRRPVHFHEVFATLYHHLGIDSATTQLTDTSGRPQYLLDHRDPIREMI